MQSDPGMGALLPLPAWLNPPRVDAWRPPSSSSGSWRGKARSTTWRSQVGEHRPSSARPAAIRGHADRRRRGRRGRAEGAGAVHVPAGGVEVAAESRASTILAAQRRARASPPVVPWMSPASLESPSPSVVSRLCGMSTSTCAPARCTCWRGRTAPARARSSRSSAGRIGILVASSSFAACRVASGRRTRPCRPGLPPFTRSCRSCRRCRSSTTCFSDVSRAGGGARWRSTGR